MEPFIARSSARLGMPIRYLREYQPLGTAGGLYFFRDLILLGDPDAVIVLHADICADFQLPRAVAFHQAVGDGSHMTVLTSRALHTTSVTASRPLPRSPRPSTPLAITTSHPPPTLSPRPKHLPPPSSPPSDPSVTPLGVPRGGLRQRSVCFGG